MSSADVVLHSYCEEVTQGVTPAVALQNINVVSSAIDGTIGTTESNQISAARMTPDLVRTEGSTSGNLAIEWSFGAYEDFLEGALGSDWTTPFSLTATDISAATADDSFNSVAAAFNTATVLPGHWIKVSGFATAANNGIFKVVSVTTAKIVVSANLVNEAAGPSVTIKGKSLRNGLTKKSYSLEKHFADLTTTYISHKGLVVNTCNISAATGSIVTGSFDFMGMTTTPSNTTIGTGANTTAVSNRVFDSLDSIGTIYVDGVAFSGCISSINLTTNNNSRNQNCLGSLFPTSVNLGTLSATGDISVYFNSYALYEKFLAGTDISLSYSFSDVDGNVMVIDLPKVILSSAAQSGISRNSDVMLDLGFQAVIDSTAGYGIQISALAA